MVGKPKSCTACRQAKTACDARNTTPTPCSRCSSKDIECRFDRTFRRIPTRQYVTRLQFRSVAYSLILFRIVRDITNEAHSIRATQNLSTQNLSTQTASATEGRRSPLAESNVVPSFLLLNDAEAFPDFLTGSVSISAKVVLELLQQYGLMFLLTATAANHSVALGSITTPMRLLYSLLGH